MLPLVIGAAVVSIGATAAAWLFNSMTEEEKRKHSVLEGKIASFGEKFENLVDKHNDNQEQLIYEAFLEIKQDYLDQIAFFKEEKKTIKLDLEKVSNAISDELKNDAISPYVRKSLLVENNRVQDAFKRLEAYWSYIEWFEHKVIEIEQDKKFAELFDIQPASLLPSDYLYIGKLANISKNELDHWNVYGQTLQLKSVKIDNNNYSKKQELENLDFYIKNNIATIPIFIDHMNKSRKFFDGSIAKAELWQSLMTGSQLEAKPIKDEWNNSKFLEIDYKGVKCRLNRKDKQYPLKNYRKTFPLKLKITENDFLMRQIQLSEKTDVPEKQNNEEILILFDLESIEKPQLDKLSNYLDNFNLCVSEIDINNNKIIFKISDFELLCEIHKDEGCLKLSHINITSIGSTKNFEPPYDFTFIPINTYVEDLQFSPQKALTEFIEFANNQFQYIKFSNKNKSKDYDFFRKWNAALDFQINANSFNETSFSYTQITPIENSLVIQLKEGDFNKLKHLIDKCPFYSKKFLSIEIECKQSSDTNYEIIDIGSIDDILDDEFAISIKLGHPSIVDFVFNKRNDFILKVPISPSALLRQQSALKDFGIGKIINSEIKTDLISPSIVQSKPDNNWTGIIEDGLGWQNKQLTKNQKQTIIKVLLEKNISLVQGPPGTGKTTIIKELAYQQLKHKPTEKILIVSQQNVAVDNALSRIYKENTEWFDGEKFSFVRIAPNEDKVSDDLKKFTVNNWFNQYKTDTQQRYPQILNNNSNLGAYCTEWWNLIDKPELRNVDNEIIEILINSHNIIGATCVGLANRSIGLDLVEFDIAIIDEAGRATPPELLIPILRAKKVVLIGDHYQLPPSYDRKLIAAVQNDSEDILPSIDKEFLEKSFFERLFEQLPQSNKSMLTDQFRMPNKVGKLISSLFYDGKLNNGLDRNLPEQITWINVQGKQEKDKGKTSSYNIGEINKIVDLISQINKSLFNNNTIKTVAIITPYSEQKIKIRNRIIKLGKLSNISSLKVDTVDAFQGEEAQVVIYSTVRTYGNLSFLIDRKRLNVAISRTQENLYFVGNKKFLRNAKVKGKKNLFKEIIEFMEC